MQHNTHAHDVSVVQQMIPFSPAFPINALPFCLIICLEKECFDLSTSKWERLAEELSRRRLRAFCVEARLMKMVAHQDQRVLLTYRNLKRCKRLRQAVISEPAVAEAAIHSCKVFTIIAYPSPLYLGSGAGPCSTPLLWEFRLRMTYQPLAH